LTRRDMKRLAKLKMRAPVPNAIVMGLVFAMISYVLSSISQTILFGPMVNEMMADPENFIKMLESGYTPDVSFFGSLLAFVIDMVSILMRFGFMIYVLTISRDYPAGFGTLFDGFALFFKVLWLYIRMGIVIFLWSLLLFVPGIVAVYSYRQSAYLLMDHPDWSVKQCMRESKRLMRGHKMDLFVLDLSFIGWYLLTAFPFMMVYVLPYTKTTYAIFYNQLIGWQPEEADSASLPEKSPWEY